MKLEEVKCPSCNANIIIENDVEYCFCNYCGRQIHINDEVNKSIHTRVIRDEARLKEADVRQREIEAKREIALRRLESAEKKRENDAKNTRVGVLIYFLAILLLLAISFGAICLSNYYA